MKTALLLRHAKSNWKQSALADHDRPLKKRGRRDAPLMGAFLRGRDLTPGLVLCSSAKRAVETLELLFDDPPETGISKSLYMAHPGDLMAALRAAPDGHASVMIIGHNPGLELLAGQLAGSGDAVAVERLAVKYPTCGLAVISFDVAGWRDIGPRLGHLDSFTIPGDLIL